MANKIKILVFTIIALSISAFCVSAEESAITYYNSGYTNGGLSAATLDGEECLKFTPNGSSTSYVTASINTNPNEIVADKTILSFDINAAQTHQYSYLQLLGKGADNPRINMAGVLVSKDGKLGYRTAPTWEGTREFPNGNDAYSGYVLTDMEVGQWYHIDIIFDNTTGTASYYLDGEPWGSGNTFPKGTAFNQMYITARGGEGYNDSPTGQEAIYYDNIMGASIYGNEMVAYAADINTEEQAINLIFSESPQEEDLYNIKIVNTVSNDELVIETINKNNNLVTINYSGETEALTEYAVIVPEGIVGLFGITEENVLYFHTKAGGDETIETVWDYTENDLSFGTGMYLYEKTLDDGHGDVLVMASASTNGITVPSPTIDFPKEDISYISFDLQPKSTAYPIGINVCDENGNPWGIAFNLNGLLLIGEGWLGADFIRLSPADVDRWASWANAGSFNADDWVNVKIVNNQKNKEISYYVNNELLRTAPTTLAHFGSMRIVQYNNEKNVPQGEEMLYIDNVKVGYYTQELKVKNARFISSAGKEFGPFANISRDLNKVAINFQTEVAEESLNENTVKLFYGGAPVEYTALDFDGYTYTIQPKTIPGPGDAVTVEVIGAYNANNKPVTDYKTVCFADSEDGSLMISGFELVDTDGEVTEDETGARYVKAGIYNTTDETKEIIVTLTGYNDEKMTYFDFRKYTLNSGDAVILDESGYNEILEITGIEDYSEVQAVVLNGGEMHHPMIAPIELGN